MAWLNYNHLYYFWTVAREGSIARAAKKLGRSQPTLSAQLRLLDAAMGDRLFARAGRGIQLTDLGRDIFRQADDLFHIGENLARQIEGRPFQQHVQLVVGLVDAIPKPAALELLKFARESGPPLRIVCREDRHERLIASLALNELDVVLSDRPAESSGRHHLQSRPLGASEVSFFADSSFRRLKKGFPKSLQGAPMLLPTQVSAYRGALDHWFEGRKISPDIVGEFEDFSLMALFGRQGHGIFPAASFLPRVQSWPKGLVELGRARGAQLRFYAIFSERSAGHASSKRLLAAVPGALFSREKTALH